MEKFSAEKFYAIGVSLADLKCQFQTIKRVEGEHIANFAKYFEDIAGQCESIGLTLSTAMANKAASEMKGSNPAESVKHYLKAVSETIELEMASHSFHWV